LFGPEPPRRWWSGRLDLDELIGTILALTKVTEIQFPLTLGKLGDQPPGAWACFAGNGDSDFVLEKLKQRYAEIEVGFVKKLGDFVLSHREVSLSVLSNGQQWLSLRRGDSHLALLAPPLEDLPFDGQPLFPFHKVEGLEPFLRFFGGMANWGVPPCPWFLPFANTARDIVSVSTMDLYGWGVIDRWEGALILYATCGGNLIVVTPHNQIGKWDHEYCWVTEEDEESPWTDLETNLEGLVEQFIAYQSLDGHSDEAKTAPFYY
jgi:hypothetical protein